MITNGKTNWKVIELVETRPDARLQLSVIVDELIRLNDSQWYPSSVR